MLKDLFVQVVPMSVTASIVILAVLIARLALKKAPKIFSYALWLVVPFRLVFPFSFQSEFSLLPSKEILLSTPLAESIVWNDGVAITGALNNGVFPASTAFTNTAPSGLENWLSMGSLIWLAGIAVLLLYSVLSLLELRRHLKHAMPDYDNIYLVKTLDSPFVLGVLRPRIYLPDNLTVQEKRYILLHEQTHIKRFDHLIKLLSFLLLCLHWFNPFVWLAFFLSCKDMEMSCDESVIKKLGSDAKKDYSSVLLSLTTGRKRLGATPLAFGEGDTKHRIQNILHYKKPTLWVLLCVTILVIALGLGLTADPMQASTTDDPIQDQAEAYLTQTIEDFEEHQPVQIVDRKITKLEKLTRFDGLTDDPIELWNLEFRLKPDDMSKVILAGGMNEIDGWLTEYSSMGQPVLVFSFEQKSPKLIGTLWNGDTGQTSASREIALRNFLEGAQLLPQETYPGTHALASFIDSSGQTCQLLLSKPVSQEGGNIWCVERWMDGNGTIYHAVPETDLSLSAYYKDLQQQCDQGHKPWLLNPEGVALDYINNDLGQGGVQKNLTVKTPATLKDFLQTPESRYFGYISEFEADDDLFHLDTAEWITSQDTERMKALNLTENRDMPNGYYIYNPNSYPLTFFVDDKTTYQVIRWNSSSQQLDTVTLKRQEKFADYLKQYTQEYGTTPPFWIVTKNGYVVSITEQSIEIMHF